MKIIGFTGKKGVGKNFVADLVAEVLRKSGHTVEQGALADPIKEFGVFALGLDRNILYGNDEAKNAPTEYRWENMPTWLWERVGKPSGFVTHRQAAQIIGTELGRDIWDKDIWVKAMERRTRSSKADYWLVTDVRFPNEVDAVRSWGGEVWKIDGPRAVASGDRHASENSLGSNIQYDAVIINGMEDTRETLKAKIEQALELQKAR